MRAKRTTFKTTLVPTFLLAPQLLITFVFFVWPSVQAIWQSVLREDAFGTTTQFVGMANFARLAADPTYLASAGVTPRKADSTAASYLRPGARRSLQFEPH